MQDILSVGEMRMSDAIAISSIVPGMELMRRAGEGIFRAAEWKPPVAVVCGTGNNAGDGFVTAMMLQEAGIACDIILQEESFTPDGKFWFGCCRAKGVPVRTWAETETLQGYGTVEDCIFGTGFHGKAEGEAARMIRLINESGAYVVSADINSGLNGDNGLAEEAVRSDLTVCIGSWQPGHFLSMAGDLIGEKVCVDIGIPPKGRGMKLFEREDAAALFPPRRHFSHKGDYGTAALIGGSVRYSGAVRLAALADAGIRSGAGIARVCAPRSLCEKMIPEILEATLFPLDEKDGGMVFREETFREALRGCRTAAFGMGAGNTEETRKAVRFLLNTFEGVLILDADGLNALAAMDCAGLAEAKGKVILTPHPGEFSRLSGKTTEKILNNPIPLAEEFARKHRVTVLLKGPATIITDGTRTFLTDRGTPGMAAGGSGDVLSGVLAAVAAQHPVPVEAAAAAAWINGKAGETARSRVGDVSMSAGDTVSAIPQTIREIRGETAFRTVEGLSHVAIRVRDIQKSIRYYTEILGLQEAFRMYREDGSLGTVYLYLAPGQYLELFSDGTRERDAGPDLIGMCHICLMTKDITGSYEAVRSRGGALDSGIKRGKSRCLMFWTHDPDGTQIEVMEMPPESMQAQADRRLAAGDGPADAGSGEQNRPSAQNIQ